MKKADWFFMVAMILILLAGCVFYLHNHGWFGG